LTKNVTNLAASVRQRLANLARQRIEDFGLLLTKYALERLLFRISQSEYQKIFVLKGALLFELWTEQAHRPTRDADFLSNGDNDPGRFETIRRPFSGAGLMGINKRWCYPHSYFTVMVNVSVLLHPPELV
jgi:hypothetical protein